MNIEKHHTENPLRSDQLTEEEKMRAIAELIVSTFPDSTFTLLINAKHEPMGNYISNAVREDMIAAMRETADRLEQGQFYPAEAMGRLQ